MSLARAGSTAPTREPMHLHVAYYIAALMGFTIGVALTYPLALVLSALITATGVIVAAWLQRGRREGQGEHSHYRKR